MSDMFEGMPRPTNLAYLSEDGLYRYTLTRLWGRGPAATFILLNPSTADAFKNDATVRRGIGFARAWGCAGLYFLNVYALRSTNPGRLWQAEDPIGPENDKFLSGYATEATRLGWPLVAAWGVHAKPERVATVLALPGMESLQSFGVTKDGAPPHPLYLKSNTPLTPWPPR